MFDKASGIYYKAKPDQSTHFVSIKDNRVKDPYQYFQFPETHGFCQLYAFFLYTDNVSDFQKVDFNEKLTRTNFQKYADNSFQCLKKLSSILKNPKYKKVRKAFKSDFENLDRDYFGIEEKATFLRFTRDLEKLTFDQAKEEMGQVYDMSLKFKLAKSAQGQFWKTQQVNSVNQKLCVQPTSGESQYEAFQAIIAYCFSADEGSPYRELLKVHQIDLIEDNQLPKVLKLYQKTKQTQNTKVSRNFAETVSKYVSSFFSPSPKENIE